MRAATKRVCGRRVRRLQSLRVVLCAAWVLVPALLGAQDFTLDWFAVAGGGGESSGGDYTLASTIGQSLAGGMGGGDYALEGGFWSIVGDPGEPPVLRIAVAAPSSVVISWPVPRPGWVLQQSSTLGPSASWTDVVAPVVVNGSDNSVTQPVASGNRFYRLRHP